MNIEVCKIQILKIVDDLNRSYGMGSFQFHQQVAKVRNMSITGANGRLYIQPAGYGYGVSVSGKAGEAQLHTTFRRIFGKENDGEKQSGSQAFWKTDDINLVESAAMAYAKTR